MKVPIPVRLVAFYTVNLSLLVSMPGWIASYRSWGADKAEVSPRVSEAEPSRVTPIAPSAPVPAASALPDEQHVAVDDLRELR